MKATPPVGLLGILLLVSGCGFSSTTKVKVVTATPTRTPRATAPPTVAIPTAPPTVSGSPVPTSAPATSASTDASFIASHGFVPGRTHAQTPDGFGHTLYAFRAICKGSADGYCQKVFFFVDTRYLGTDTSAESTSIPSVVAAGIGTIAITYANYRPHDPNCCPTGKPVTITYHWNGSRIIPSGVPPGH